MGKPSTDQTRHTIFKGPLEIVLVYFTVSAVWILLSDNIVYFMVADPSMRNNLSMIKGIAFILLTSILLFYLVKRGFDSLRDSQSSLRQSETRIRAMIERAPYGIIESDEKGVIVRANLEANDILGTTSEELIGLNLNIFIDPASSSAPKDVLEQENLSLAGVQRFVRKNGVPIWVQRISTHISDQNGSEGYILELVQDVTEQKDSAIQLSRRAEELEVLYDASRKVIESEVATDSLESICGVAVERLQASSALVYYMTVSGNMELAAKKGASPNPTIDLQSSGALGDQIRIIHQMEGAWAVIPLIEEDRPIGAMVFGHSQPGWFTKARLAPFQSLANLSLLAIQKVRMVEALKLYANNLEDKVAERTKDLTDITDRLAEEVKRTKEAQERLSQEKEMLDVTLHSIGESVIVTDTEGTILLANQIAEENGSQKGPIIGSRISDILPIRDPLTDGLVKQYWVARDPESISEQKGMVLRANGRRELSYNSAPVRDRSGNAIGYVIVFRDITDEVRMQRAVAEAQRLESIGQLAGGIAHSFNNILTSILGNIEMVGYAKLEPARRDACLDDARQSAMKAKDLSNQLLTFSKGGDPIRKNISILNVLMELSERLSGGSRINIKVASTNDPYMVNADEVQIGQAFINLMTNALASAPPNVILGVSLSHQDIENARTKSYAISRYVVVNLEAPNWISQRSESDPEAQVSAMDEKQGLDLAIANSIVRRHDGFMVMDSSVKGSNYKVYLLAWSDGVSAPSVSSRQRMDRPAKVLVMDDDEGVLDVLTGMIQIMGHSVVAAKEGGEAIDLYSQAEASGEPFDVVIMDLNIPGGLGGRETIRRLMERYTKVNAIVSSGYSNDPITANYLSYGFKGVLPKPYTMKQLEEAIQKAMVEN